MYIPQRVCILEILIPSHQSESKLTVSRPR